MEYKRGGTYCAAQSCNACTKGSPGLSFHTFPKDPERCKLWVQNVGRQDLEEKDLSALARSYKLCANHFEGKMFMNQNDRKRLVWNAVPTIFESAYKMKHTNVDKKLTQAPLQCLNKSQTVSATLPQKTSSCQSSSLAPSADDPETLSSENTVLQKTVSLSVKSPDDNCPSFEEKEDSSELEMVVVHPKQYHDYCISQADDKSGSDMRTGLGFTISKEATDTTDVNSSVFGCHDYAKAPPPKSATNCHDYTETGSTAGAKPAEEKCLKDEGPADNSEGILSPEQIEHGVKTEETSVVKKSESFQKVVSPLLKRGKIKKVLTISGGKVKSVFDMNSGRVKTITEAKDLKTIKPILHRGKIKKIMTVNTNEIASIVNKIKVNQFNADRSLIKVKHKKFLNKLSVDHVKIMNTRNLGSVSLPVPDILTKPKSSSVENENSNTLIPLSSPSSSDDAIPPKSTPTHLKSKSPHSENFMNSMKLIPKAANIFTKNVSVQTNPLITLEKRFLDKERLKKYTRLIQKHQQRFYRMKKKYNNLVGKAAGLQDVGKPTQILRDSAKYLSDYQLSLLGCQLYMSSVQLNGRRYSSMIRGFVNRVFYNHPVAYDFLGKILTLPPDRTVKSWMRTAAKGPGFHQDLFELLKERMEKLEDDSRVCTLQFSGIPIDSELEQGDNGNFTVVTKAICIMVKGMKTEWTQLMSYFLLTDEACMVDILYDIVTTCIRKLYDINVRVKAIVCDESDITRAMYHRLGIHPKAPYFFQGEVKIHCLYNPTELLISTRDALKNHNIIAQKKIAKWEHIMEFYQKDMKMKIRLAPQLSCQYIAARDRVRTGVKMAAQTMSRTVASGLCTHASLESLPAEALDTANFINKIDQLFDLFNSQSENGNKKSQRGFQGDPAQLAFLKDTEEWISKWQAVGAAGTIESQEGWLLTINGLIGLWKDLQNQHNFKILFTRRLNLDSMDAFFDLVRKKSLLDKKLYPTSKHLMDSFRHAAITSLKQVAYDDQCFEELARKIMENCSQSYGDELYGHTPPSDSICVTQETTVMNNPSLSCVNMETSQLHEPVLSSNIQVEEELTTFSQNKCEYSQYMNTQVEMSNPQNTGDLLQRQNENSSCTPKTDTEFANLASVTLNSSENALGGCIPDSVDDIPVSSHPSSVDHQMSAAEDERATSLTKTKKIWGVRKRLRSQRSIKMIKERKKLLQELVKTLQVTYKS